MTQSHYAGGDFDPFYRSQQRNMIPGHYYHRAIPYGYHDYTRQELGPDYAERQSPYTLIHEPDAPAQNEQQRRRIAVAVSNITKSWSNGSLIRREVFTLP